MTRNILSKLTALLKAGIASEIEAVYLLVGIRKLIERDCLRDQFNALNFHCDWVLHSHLDRKVAKAILARFDAAHTLLKGGVKLRTLPTTLRQEIERISEMSSFETELHEFLTMYDLPTLDVRRPDAWTHFLHLYARVVEDIPLVVSANSKSIKHITQVTVHYEEAKEPLVGNDESHILFKVRWDIHNKTGKIGELFVLNTFALAH
jgi:hypothetical protein